MQGPKEFSGKINLMGIALAIPDQRKKSHLGAFSNAIKSFLFVGGVWRDGGFLFPIFGKLQSKKGGAWYFFGNLKTQIPCNEMETPGKKSPPTQTPPKFSCKILFVFIFSPRLNSF
jgi:hypothetical protein